MSAPATYANKFTVSHYDDGTSRILFLDERGKESGAVVTEAACVVLTTPNALALATLLTQTKGA